MGSLNFQKVLTLAVIGAVATIGCTARSPLERRIEIREPSGDGAITPTCSSECVTPQSCNGGSVPGVCGATYYIAAQGGLDSTTGLDPAAPWASFEHAWTVLLPGDALVLQDGTYPPLRPAVSGTESSPIAIRADNDGQAILDSAFSSDPACHVQGPTNDDRLHDLVLDGLVCRNSTSHTLRIHQAERIVLRRVTASSDAPNSDSTTLVWRSSDILLEDVAAAGGGSSSVFVIISASSIVARRAYALYDFTTNVGTRNGFTLNNCSQCTVENSVARAIGGATCSSCVGLTVQDSENAVLQGNVVYGPFAWAYTVTSTRLIEQNSMRNSVAFSAERGVFQRGVALLDIQNATLTEVGNRALSIRPDESPQPPDFSIGTRLRNSVLTAANTALSVWDSPWITFVDNDYNTIFGATLSYVEMATPGSNEISVEPDFQTDKYGNGAYLLPVLEGQGEAGAAMGAEVRHRYEGDDYGPGVMGTFHFGLGLWNNVSRMSSV